MGSTLPALVLLLVPFSAGAAFHRWKITEVYSNASGSVQYVEFYDLFSSEHLLAGHTLQSTTNPTTFTFSSNLPSSSTANQHMLVATPGFASLPGAVTPDYTLSAWNFFATAADTLNFAAGFDTITWTADQLPTDGIDALHEDYDGTNRHTGPNTPTNFAGQQGSLPEPSEWLGLLVGTAAVLALTPRRAGETRHLG
jgi:serralysin